MKIFGIGLSKTGTTSLASALGILGYKVKDCLGVSYYAKGDLSSIDMQILLSNDAFTDTPIPSFFRELDIAFPNSKFILTVRDMEGWLASCKKQFNQKHADMQLIAQKQLFIDLYGTPVFDAEKFRDGYDHFTSDVINYFKDRPNDLLIMNVANGDGWDKLCPFLDKPEPEAPFPKANVTQIAWLNPIGIAKTVWQSSAALRELSSLEWQDGCGNRKNSAHHRTGPRLPNNWLSKILLRWRNNKIHRSKQKTLRIIKTHLRNLNSAIPIVIEDDLSTPFKERSRWNHFWLIGVEGLPAVRSANAAEYAPVINVALIQDRTPFLGVMYYPLQDVMYCAAANKGASKISNNGEPREISSRELPSLPVPGKEMNSKFMGSFAEVICRSVDEGFYINDSFVNTEEWQTAAANALLKVIGYQLIDADTGQELKYNKENWHSKSIYISKSIGNATSNFSN